MNELRNELDVYTARDLATGNLGDFTVGPDGWIRQRFGACIESIAKQMHVVVELRRTVQMPESGGVEE